MLAGILYAVGGLIEVVIGLRFILRLLGASPDSSFVQWVYSWSTPLVTPFAGIFGQNATVAGPGVAATSVFDWTALIALIIYGLIIAAITRVTARR
ncbi:MAG: YggT family protein [Candidatus Saccharimonadales bacterium]